MAKTKPIRVLIVDDHPVVLSGFKAFIKANDGLILAGEAENGADAISMCEKTNPGVILMDLVMLGMDGISAIKEISGKWPEIKIIALTSFVEGNMVEGAIKAGAISYLQKEISADELFAAIKDAAVGNPVFSTEAKQIIIKDIRDQSSRKFKLTVREKEVLLVLIEGLSNKEIAGQLSISRSTVKFHISNILNKLGASSRTEAVSLSLKQNLVTWPGKN